MTSNERVASENGDSQTTFGNTTFFRPEWADSDDTTRFIERELLEGEVLNFPCGTSRLGDLRVDIDPTVGPDAIADLESPPFDDKSFDTVYCDPPYSMHAFDRNQWVRELWDVARQRLVLQTTTQIYRLPNASRRVFLADRGNTMVFQVLQVFDRHDGRLSDYSAMADGGMTDDE